MSKRFRVLGCDGSQAQGTCTSCFLLGDDTLFDVGSAASTLTLAEQAKIKRIFLTHGHLDHTKDLAFIGENAFEQVTTPIEVFGTDPVLKAVRSHLLNDVIWPDFSAIPTVQRPLYKYTNIRSGERVAVGDLMIEAVEVNHAGPAVGFLICGKKNTIVYSGDTGPTDLLWEAINRVGNVSHLIIETSWPNRLETLAHIAKHLTVAMLANELKKLKNPNVKIYITHLKAPSRDETLAQLEALGDKRIRVLGRDDVFEIS